MQSDMSTTSGSGSGSNSHLLLPISINGGNGSATVVSSAAASATVNPRSYHSDILSSSVPANNSSIPANNSSVPANNNTANASSRSSGSSGDCARRGHSHGHRRQSSGGSSSVVSITTTSWDTYWASQLQQPQPQLQSKSPLQLQTTTTLLHLNSSNYNNHSSGNNAPVTATTASSSDDAKSTDLLAAVTPAADGFALFSRLYGPAPAALKKAQRQRLRQKRRKEQQLLLKQQQQQQQQLQQQQQQQQQQQAAASARALTSPTKAPAASTAPSPAPVSSSNSTASASASSSSSSAKGKEGESDSGFSLSQLNPFASLQSVITEGMSDPLLPESSSAGAASGARSGAASGRSSSMLPSPLMVISRVAASAKARARRGTGTGNITAAAAAATATRTYTPWLSRAEALAAQAAAFPPWTLFSVLHAAATDDAAHYDNLVELLLQQTGVAQEEHDCFDESAVAIPANTNTNSSSLSGAAGVDSSSNSNMMTPAKKVIATITAPAASAESLLLTSSSSALLSSSLTPGPASHLNGGGGGNLSSVAVSPSSSPAVSARNSVVSAPLDLHSIAHTDAAATTASVLTHLRPSTLLLYLNSQHAALTATAATAAATLTRLSPSLDLDPAEVAAAAEALARCGLAAAPLRLLRQSAAMRARAVGALQRLWRGVLGAVKAQLVMVTTTIEELGGDVPVYTNNGGLSLLAHSNPGDGKSSGSAGAGAAGGNVAAFTVAAIPVALPADPNQRRLNFRSPRPRRLDPATLQLLALSPRAVAVAGWRSDAGAGPELDALVPALVAKAVAFGAELKRVKRVDKLAGTTATVAAAGAVPVVPAVAVTRERRAAALSALLTAMALAEAADTAVAARIAYHEQNINSNNNSKNDSNSNQADGASDLNFDAAAFSGFMLQQCLSCPLWPAHVLTHDVFDAEFFGPDLPTLIRNLQSVVAHLLFDERTEEGRSLATWLAKTVARGGAVAGRTHALRRSSVATFTVPPPATVHKNATNSGSHGSGSTTSASAGPSDSTAAAEVSSNDMTNLLCGGGGGSSFGSNADVDSVPGSGLSAADFTTVAAGTGLLTSLLTRAIGELRTVSDALIRRNALSPRAPLLAVAAKYSRKRLLESQQLSESNNKSAAASAKGKKDNKNNAAAIAADGASSGGLASYSGVLASAIGPKGQLVLIPPALAEWASAFTAGYKNVVNNNNNSSSSLVPSLSSVSSASASAGAVGVLPQLPLWLSHALSPAAVLRAELQRAVWVLLRPALVVPLWGVVANTNTPSAGSSVGTGRRGSLPGAGAGAAAAADGMGSAVASPAKALFSDNIAITSVPLSKMIATPAVTDAAALAAAKAAAEAAVAAAEAAAAALSQTGFPPGVTVSEATALRLTVHGEWVSALPLEQLGADPEVLPLPPLPAATTPAEKASVAGGEKAADMDLELDLDLDNGSATKQNEQEQKQGPASSSLATKIVGVPASLLSVAPAVAPSPFPHAVALLATTGATPSEDLGRAVAAARSVYTTMAHYRALHFARKVKPPPGVSDLGADTFFPVWLHVVAAAAARAPDLAARVQLMRVQASVSGAAVAAAAEADAAEAAAGWVVAEDDEEYDEEDARQVFEQNKRQTLQQAALEQTDAAAADSDAAAAKARAEAESRFVSECPQALAAEGDMGSGEVQYYLTSLQSALAVLVQDYEVLKTQVCPVQKA